MKLVRLTPLAALFLGACLQSVQPVASPTTFIPERQPDRLRIMDSSGSVFVLDKPELIGDAIRGYDQVESQSLTIALRDVQRVEARQFSRTRLALAALAVSGGGFLIYQAFTNSSDGPTAVCNREKFSQIINYCEPVPPQPSVGFRLRLR